MGLSGGYRKQKPTLFTTGKGISLMLNFLCGGCWVLFDKKIQKRKTFRVVADTIL